MAKKQTGSEDRLQHMQSEALLQCTQATVQTKGETVYRD